MNVKLPLPINSNPGMAFPRQIFNNDNEGDGINNMDMLIFATKVIRGFIDHKKILDE
jgi:choline O-acetyltransferase